MFDLFCSFSSSFLFFSFLINADENKCKLVVLFGSRFSSTVTIPWVVATHKRERFYQINSKDKKIKKYIEQKFLIETTDGNPYGPGITASKFKVRQITFAQNTRLETGYNYRSLSALTALTVIGLVSVRLILSPQNSGRIMYLPPAQLAGHRRRAPIRRESHMLACGTRAEQRSNLRGFSMARGYQGPSKKLS